MFPVKEYGFHEITAVGVREEFDSGDGYGDIEVGFLADSDTSQLFLHAHGVGRVDGGSVDDFLGEHLVVDTTERHDEFHVTGRR